jgi:hypothetical protein
LPSSSSPALIAAIVVGPALSEHDCASRGGASTTASDRRSSFARARRTADADGYYNPERILDAAICRGAEVGLCGTCMDARGMREGQIVEGARRSTLERLTDWKLWADKLIMF